MCLTVIPRPPLQQLCIAAQRITELLGDGTLTAALGEGKHDAMTTAAAAFDRLEECVERVQSDQKEVSPFLRYRQEILGEYETARSLQALVMNLNDGIPVNLRRLFKNADEHHTRIAMDCLAQFTNKGDDDQHFVKLAEEIINRESKEQQS